MPKKTPRIMKVGYVLVIPESRLGDYDATQLELLPNVSLEQLRAFLLESPMSLHHELSLMVDALCVHVGVKFADLRSRGFVPSLMKGHVLLVVGGRKFNPTVQAYKVVARSISSGLARGARGPGVSFLAAAAR